MSIANLKDSGNQGNNMPWQWKMLQGLQAIADATSAPLTCVEDSVTICNANIDAFTFTNILGVGESLNVNIANTIPLEVNLDPDNDSVGIYGYTNPADPSTFTGIKVDANGELQVDILSLPNEGQQTMANSISVALASNQSGASRTPTFLRPAGTSGTVAAGTFSMSFASVGTANATVGGITLKPGETLNFDAGAINNTLGAVTYSTVTAGSELIIITLT